jgi:hypothetical protein
MRKIERKYRRKNRKQVGIAYAFLEKWVQDQCPYCNPNILNMFLMLVDDKFRDDIIRRQTALLGLTPSGSRQKLSNHPEKTPESPEA